VVEVVPENAVVWTKPEDWKVDFDDPTKGVARDDRDVITALFCDGSVRTLHKNFDAAMFKALLTRNGKESISF
jgi:hypothetical protein